MGSAQYLKRSVVVVSREDSRRIDAFVQKIGGKRLACEALKCGTITIEAGMEQGRMQRSTLARLLAALDEMDEVRAAAIEGRVSVLEGQVSSLQMSAPRGIPR